jgi:hypothetical protein
VRKAAAESFDDDVGKLDRRKRLTPYAHAYIGVRLILECRMEIGRNPDEAPERVDP